jgi:DNA-binding MurR/RpiR family transcriptional regulator
MAAKKPKATTEETAAAPDVLIRIRAAIPNLRPAEQRVAHAVITDPAGLATWSITQVAEHCSTSETTVSRFVRELGYDGYPQFRLAVTRVAALEEAAIERPGKVPSPDISARDTLEQIVQKLTYSDAKAIEDTARQLDLSQLARAVEEVVAARRIDICGIEASGFVAVDLAQKLHRIGRTAFAWTDSHAVVTAAALVKQGDVFIGVSHRGQTTDTVMGLRMAREAKATTIAITNHIRSPLADEADVVLTTAARETTFRSGATASRIAQLAVIDYLFVAVASRTFNTSVKALERTRAAVDRLGSLPPR